MPSILGCAFDLEGTVVDVEAAHHLAHLRVAAELGVILSLESAVREVPSFVGGPDALVIQQIMQLAGNPTQATQEELVERTGRYYRKNLETTEVFPRKGFLGFLKWARETGRFAAIGSATPTEEALILLKRSGLSEVFGASQVVLLEDVKAQKPAPDVFLKTAERMGISPAAQLVFEDSLRGVRAGVAAGSPVVAMPVHGFPSAVIPLVQAGACRLFMSWMELNPHHLLSNLEQELG